MARRETVLVRLKRAQAVRDRHSRSVDRVNGVLCQLEWMIDAPQRKVQVAAWVDDALKRLRDAWSAPVSAKDNATQGKLRRAMRAYLADVPESVQQDILGDTTFMTSYAWGKRYGHELDVGLFYWLPVDTRDGPYLSTYSRKTHKSVDGGFFKAAGWADVARVERHLWPLMVVYATGQLECFAEVEAGAESGNDDADTAASAADAATITPS